MSIDERLIHGAIVKCGLKKIKIIRIQSRICIGGPAIHTILLSSEMNKDRFRTILVGGALEEGETDITSFARSKSVNIVVMNKMGRKIRWRTDLITLIKLYALMKKERPDIVHTHTAKAGTLGRIAAYLAGVPIILHTFHGHIFHGYFNPYISRMFLLLERALGKITDKIIVISNQQFYEICKIYKIANEGKFEIIPLGLELDKFLEPKPDKDRLEYRKKLGITTDTILVGVIGRLVPIKNHRMFLQAAKSVLSKSQILPIKVKFLIVGDGELRTQLEDYAKQLEITNDVIFTGWQNCMDTVYDSLDIIALTSVNEGTPLTLIEAMAAGKPVIATNVGGVQDIVIDGYNGVLVPPNEPEIFADRLLELLQDMEMRNKFARTGRNFVKEKFHYRRLVSDMEKLYEGLLAKKCNTLVTIA